MIYIFTCKDINFTQQRTTGRVIYIHTSVLASCQAVEFSSAQVATKSTHSHSVIQSLYFSFSQDISVRPEQPVQPAQNKHNVKKHYSTRSPHEFYGKSEICRRATLNFLTQITTRKLLKKPREILVHSQEKQQIL